MMNDYWTFTNNELKWERDEFSTRLQAIQQAKKEFNDTFYIGQMEETEHLTFSIVNIEEVRCS